MSLAEGSRSLSVLLASVLACLAAWVLWSNLSKKRRHDLHKVSGPRHWPIVGNLPDMLGAKGLQLHKVQEGCQKRPGLQLETECPDCWTHGKSQAQSERYRHFSILRTRDADLG